MFELYLDSADVSQIRRFNSCLSLSGITTNPSILASARVGLTALLEELAELLGKKARFFAQVVSEDVDGMVAEAIRLHTLPYDLVVKVPATESGLTAIRRIKADRIPIPVLATAIYSTQQGFLAAISGADYLAPYVNRIDMLGADGVAVVADLQRLLTQQNLNCKILAASFKSSRQAMAVIQCGVGAITLSAEIADQMLKHPAVLPAVQQFSHDWQAVFGSKLSYQS